MKLRSSTITHKSDVGGVVLDLRSADAVADAYRAMQERVAQVGGPDAMEGVVIQRMVAGGQEVILGMTQDPVFGPLVMVGLGGVQVELLKDVTFALHPLLDVDPARMLQRLTSYPLLTGWRGSPRRDIAALEDTMLRFSALVDDLPEITELEINPVVVLPDGQGCAVIDVRARIRSA